MQLHALLIFILMGLSMMVPSSSTGANSSFLADVAFLRQHVETIVLGSEAGGPGVAIVPQYQGRVMTSTTGGAAEPSFGWINFEQIAAGKLAPHINAYGGEERFWLGPEGGQFSIFFPPGAAFEFENWQTPAAIDTAAYEVVERNNSSVRFRYTATLTNYAKTAFNLEIDRKIELLTREEAAASLGATLDDVELVGYRSTNRVTNVGDTTWQKTSGLLSIWILGMYKPGPHTTIVLPYQTGPEAELGPIVNDAYFGKPPAERLKIGDGVLFFSGDGHFRSKLGLSPQRARAIGGSWDADSNVLTIVKYSPPKNDNAEYVNSMWEVQAEPYSGDAVNTYNDGPPMPGGKPLGPFYELETSSPALALSPGATAEHVQETFHLTGDRAALDRIAKQLLGAGLAEIEAALH